MVSLIFSLFTVLGWMNRTLPLIAGFADFSTNKLLMQMSIFSRVNRWSLRIGMMSKTSLVAGGEMI